VDTLSHAAHGNEGKKHKKEEDEPGKLNPPDKRKEPALILGVMPSSVLLVKSSGDATNLTRQPPDFTCFQF
jgi:hypothetical protein